eukprot:scaffold104777_cov32-Tisochrysis_lutea.AAC.1
MRPVESSPEGEGETPAAILDVPRRRAPFTDLLHLLSACSLGEQARAVQAPPDRYCITIEGAKEGRGGIPHLPSRAPRSVSACAIFG